MADSAGHCAGCASSATPGSCRMIPLPQSQIFDRLAEFATVDRLTAFIKSDLRNRLAWRREQQRKKNS